MKVTKEVIDEYTAFKTRTQPLSTADEARLQILLHDIILPAYKEDPSLAARIDRVVELKRSMTHLLALHDSLRQQIIRELESLG